MILLRTNISFIFFISVTTACIPCLNNVLSSDGDFGVFYPRYLGNWVLSGDYDGNPFYTCPWDCHGLRGFLVSFYFFLIIKYTNQSHTYWSPMKFPINNKI